MVELALLREEGLFASPFEMQSERICYTVDTLEYFRQNLPSTAELVLIVGGDSLAQFSTWRRWQRLPELAEIAALVRPGWQRSALPDDLTAALAGRLERVENPPLDISSTALRRIFACGEIPPPGTMSPEVIDYIHKYGLYERLQRKDDAPGHEF